MHCVAERPFLSADWRHVAMVSYEIDPSLLKPLVPEGTEVDFWNGRCFVSLVGLVFERVRVRGLPVPFHTHFEEVNLRFYVRREVGDEVRRAVVFVKELVPLPAVAAAARWSYGERYSSLPMRHRAGDGELAYEWRLDGRWQGFHLVPDPDATESEPGSEEEFISEHYWGYVRGRRGTVEYRVEHPRWRVSRATQVEVALDAERLYGPAFAAALAGQPTSAFVAAGSAVEVMPGRLLESG
jgi:uncharacterized protein YqjF (DUF2071 family)